MLFWNAYSVSYFKLNQYTIPNNTLAYNLYYFCHIKKIIQYAISNDLPACFCYIKQMK